MAIEPVKDVIVPEVWAAAALAVLSKNLVMAGLVHRDFEGELGFKKGDTVRVRRPRKLQVQNWTGVSVDSDSMISGEIDIEMPRSEQMSIVLDSMKHVSFIVEDVPQSTAIAEIDEEYVQPAMIPMAEQIDSDILAEMCNVTSTDIGGDEVPAVSQTALGTGAAADEGDIIALKSALDVALCPADGRQLVLGTDHEADLLGRSLFHQANTSGSDETLRGGVIGRAFGFTVRGSQNIPGGPSDESTQVPQSVAFHRNALAFVSRPLRSAPGGLGAVSRAFNNDSISVRYTAQYSIEHKGTIISFDTLYGADLIDINYARIMRP